MGYAWDFSSVFYYAPAFLRASLVTITLAGASSLIGTLLGIPLALLLRANKAIRIPSLLCMDVVRAVPNLVMIFLIYYFPYKEMFGVPPLSPFLSALIALAITQAAYSADVFRSAIDQTPRIQVLGLKALGFSERDVAKHAILPHVIRYSLPAHIGFWIGNLKLSSLAYVIGVEEVVFVARVSMAQSYRSLEAWIVVALIYTIIVLPFTFLLRKIERHPWFVRQ